nr:hypothetical protein [uncultured Campylobacter sp.]
MNYIFYLRTAAPDASAAPFIFTAATAGTGNSGILYYVILGLDPRISVLGNSKFIFDEILGSSRGMTQGRNSSFEFKFKEFSAEFLKFAIAAVKLGSKVVR